MKERCPRCGSFDVHGGKATIPAAGSEGEFTVHSRHCNSCGLSEEVSTRQPDWQNLLERWQQQAGSPRTLEVYWLGNRATGFWTTVNTTTGTQRWRLTVTDAEPLYTLIIEDREVDHLGADEWPSGWKLASGGLAP